MKLNCFDYNLPEELIAQTPLLKRSKSRLLLVDKENDQLKDEYFYNIIDYLKADDVLVINNTKVLPSRIYGQKTDTFARIEVLLLKDAGDYWEVLIKPARRVKVGTRIDFKLFTAEVIKKVDDGLCYLKFHYEGIFLELLNKLGEMPLPPYIHEKLKDQSRYQTVYAKDLGSAAAPTAGLHFDDELLDKIKAKGIKIVSVTLHIGLGTFRSVSVDNIEDHQMHSEHFIMTEDVANILNDAKKNKQRIVSIGTTSTRCLEAIYKKYGRFVETEEDTAIFIYPGYKFEAVDALITNFHLPKSSLVMLVSAFYSLDGIKKAYLHAIDERYRFFSFGDAMFIY